jgi:hypothetical protein
MFSGSLLSFDLNFCFLDDPDPDDGFNYKQMMVRDERRFKMADKDGDLIATKEEFTAFLHPEEYEYMKDIVVQVGKIKDSEQELSFSFCYLLLSLLPFSLSYVFAKVTWYISTGQIFSQSRISVFLKCLRLCLAYFPSDNIFCHLIGSFIK